MSPSEKLDSVLNYLVTNDTRIGTYYINLFINLRSSNSEIEKIENFAPEFERILTKLVADNYVNRDESPVITGELNPKPRYKITFDGNYFITEKGGYSQRSIDDALQNTWMKRIENAQMDYQHYMTWLTIILSVGTAIAAVYYAVELYWKYGWFHLK
jgi:hypothetical protein